jgi:hypothetical protein
MQTSNRSFNIFLISDDDLDIFVAFNRIFFFFPPLLAIDIVFPSLPSFSTPHPSIYRQIDSTLAYVRFGALPS